MVRDRGAALAAPDRPQLRPHLNDRREKAIHSGIERKLSMAEQSA